MAEQLTDAQQAVLETIDAQLERIDKILRKAEPYIKERDRLRQTRRVLLSERGVTSGGGANGRLSQEEVVRFLQEHGPSSVNAIADGVGFPASTVRSHLNRGLETRYAKEGDTWRLTEQNRSS